MRCEGFCKPEEDPLEKKMATYSNILAWKISWKKDPGGLQSMGLQRVGHDLGTKQQQKDFKVLKVKMRYGLYVLYR